MRWLYWLLACWIRFCFRWRQIFHWRQSRLLCKLRFWKNAWRSLFALDLSFRLCINSSNDSFRISGWENSVNHLHTLFIPNDILYLSCCLCLELGWWLAVAERLSWFCWCDNHSFGRRYCWIMRCIYPWGETRKGKIKIDQVAIGGE